ncbi:MAG: DUF432 domain-containing protein [Methanomicrobiaceae archaeon]|nr:DUF432 domain-containing protein [Methanomicrobiaceae archaeon]
MFGRHDYSFQYSSDSISFGIEPDGDIYRYFREIEGGEKVEKSVVSQRGKLVVCPIEPVNLPQNVATYMEIDFDPLFLEPFSKTTLYLTFPIEIGVFVVAKKDIKPLDVFSFIPQKYSLYGPSNGGVISRWVYSTVYAAIPEVNPLEYGVMQLTLHNTTREWVEVARALFEAYSMKIYYSDELVSMSAGMRILSSKTAETEFFKEPLAEGMKKAIEFYLGRDIPVVKHNGMMEWGLV